MYKKKPILLILFILLSTTVLAYDYDNFITWVKEGDVKLTEVEIKNNFIENKTVELNCEGDACQYLRFRDSILLEPNKIKRVGITIYAPEEPENDTSTGKFLFDNGTINIHLIFYQSTAKAVLDFLNEEVIIESPTGEGKDFTTKYYKIMIILSLFFFLVLFLIIKLLIKNTGISLLLAGFLIILFDVLYIVARIMR